MIGEIRKSCSGKCSILVGISNYPKIRPLSFWLPVDTYSQQQRDELFEAFDDCKFLQYMHI